MTEHRSGVPEDFELPVGYVAPAERRRIARMCRKCLTRVFGDPRWECREHPGQTITQENHPYFGRSTKEGRVDAP